jgi:membrane associated rhomboid family serine protease
LTAPPTGQWKDGPCDCLKNWSPTCEWRPQRSLLRPTLTESIFVGPPHCASGLSAFFCAPCLIGRFHDQYVVRGTYLFIVLWIVLFSISEFICNGLADDAAADSDLPKYVAFSTSASFSGFAAGVMAVFWTYFARRALRKRYQIPVGATARP